MPSKGVLIANIDVFELGQLFTTVPVLSTGIQGVQSPIDLSNYVNVSRIQINPYSEYPYGSLMFDNFVFDSQTPLLTAHRAGDYQGDEVSSDVKQSEDPSQYTILADDNYVEADGQPALDSNTAELPSPVDRVQDDATIEAGPAEGGVGTQSGDDDLARITLHQLPQGFSTGRLSTGLLWLNLSDPTAVRLFKSDGTLLYQDGVTGDGPLTLDFTNPSGYLAGLLTGDVDVWVEGVHADRNFNFAIFCEIPNTQADWDHNGLTEIDCDNVSMTIADWTYRSYDGTPVDAVEPVWGSALLAEVEEDTAAGTQGQVNESPEDFFYKNAIDGLANNAVARIQVTSDDESGDSYDDELTANADELVSSHFAALYGSEEILDADPDPDLTADQRQQILDVLGLNVVHNPSASETLSTGPADAPTDKFTRHLTIRKNFTITVNDDDGTNPADGVFQAGDHITGIASVDSLAPWSLAVQLIDAKGNVVGGVVGGNSTTFDFAVTAPGYYTLAVSGLNTLTAHSKLKYPGALLVGLPATPSNSILLDVLPAGQVLNTWQAQAWRALQPSGAVPGDPVNRVRRITELYAGMYTRRGLNLRSDLRTSAQDQASSAER